MRSSLKYQRRKLKDNDRRSENCLKLPSFLKTEFFKNVRKGVRYPTKLNFVCLDKDNSERYDGTLLNLSDNGCSAVIPELQDLKDIVVVEIHFLIDGGTHVIPFPAKHLWLSEKQHTFHHGFRFRHLSDEQQSIFVSFLVKYNKRSVAVDYLLMFSIHYEYCGYLWIGYDLRIQAGI